MIKVEHKCRCAETLCPEEEEGLVMDGQKRKREDTKEKKKKKQQPFTLHGILQVSNQQHCTTQEERNSRRTPSVPCSEVKHSTTVHTVPVSHTACVKIP